MNASFLLEVVVPVTLVILMMTAGLNIKLPELGALVLRPGLLVALSVSQYLLLPPAMLLLATLLGAEVILAITLVAIAAAPGGAFSNILTLFARGNLELSVLLTTASTVLASVFSPLVMALSIYFLAIDEVEITLDSLAVALDLFVLVLLPLAVGVVIAQFWEPVAVALNRVLPITCATAILVTLTFSLLTSWPILSEGVLPMFIASLAFALTAMALGLLVSAKQSRAVRTAISMEFGIRNLPIALLLVSHFTRDVQAIAYLLVFFVTNTSIFIIYGWSVRSRQNKDKIWV